MICLHYLVFLSAFFEKKGFVLSIIFANLFFGFLEMISNSYNFKVSKEESFHNSNKIDKHVLFMYWQVRLRHFKQAG